MLVVPVLKAQLRNERRWCAWCFRMTPDHDLNTCKSCDLTVWSVGYCDKTCQSRGWRKGGHKQECRGKKDGGEDGKGDREDNAAGVQPQQPARQEVCGTDSGSGGVAVESSGCDEGKGEEPPGCPDGDGGGGGARSDAEDSGGAGGRSGVKQRKKKEGKKTGGHRKR